MPLVNIPGAGVQNVPEEQASQYAYPTERAHISRNTSGLRPPFEPGNRANPGGRPKGMTPGRVIRETKDPFVLVDVLWGIATDADERPQYKIDAAVKLIEFGWGSAISQLHVVTEDSTAVSLQAAYLQTIREQLGLPAPTVVDGTTVHQDEAEPPQSPQPTTATPTKKRGRPRGAVDKTARKARQT